MGKRSKAKGSISLPVLNREREIAAEAARQIGTTANDIMTVGLEETVPFTCDRSGSCCSGRHHISNLIAPTEFREMWSVWKASGEYESLDQVIPAVVGRVAGVGSKHERAAAIKKKGIIKDHEVDVMLNEEGVHFIGLMFRMIPDATMVDGDRCVFLQRNEQGEFACRWHGTRAQPKQCAIAPLGMAIDKDGEVLKDRFFFPRSRAKWCDGMRLALAGKLPSTPVRDILNRPGVDFEERVIEGSRFAKAEEETRNWRRGFRNHHSPLAKLYIEKVPELSDLLVGY